MVDILYKDKYMEIYRDADKMYFYSDGHQREIKDFIRGHNFFFMLHMDDMLEVCEENTTYFIIDFSIKDQKALFDIIKRNVVNEQ